MSDAAKTLAAELILEDPRRAHAMACEEYGRDSDVAALVRHAKRQFRHRGHYPAWVR